MMKVTLCAEVIKLQFNQAVIPAPPTPSFSGQAGLA